MSPSPPAPSVPVRELHLSGATTTAFDLTRALAAQVVLLGHAFDFFNVFSFLGQPDPPPQIQRLAVVVFFLLSGFLIARSLHRHVLDPSSRFAHYLADRAARIYSGLVPALVCIAIIDALPFELFELDYFEGVDSWQAGLANLLHLQLYPTLDLPVFGSGVPLWTLAIEWWLYVFAGALVLGWRSRRRSWLALGLFPIAALSVAHNLLGGPGEGIALTWLLGATVYVASVATEKLRSRHGAIGSWPWLAGGLFVSLLTAAYSLYLPADHPAKAFDRGVALGLSLSFFLVIEGTQRWRESGASSTSVRRWARSLAGYSYTLYLTHFSVLTIGYEWRGELDDRLLLVLSILVSNLLALAVSRIGEANRRRLREWLPPQPHTTSPQTTPSSRRRSMSSSS